MKDEKKHKHLPRSGFYNHEDLEDDDFNSIANVIGISHVPDTFKNEIHHAIKHYLSEKGYVFRPSPSEAKNAIKTLIKKVNAYLRNISNPEKAKALMDFLNIYNGSVKDIATIDDLSLQLLCSTDVFSAEEIYQLIEKKTISRKEATKLREAAEKALEHVGIDKGGRPRTRSSLHGFIYSLANIYERLTGRKASITYDDYSPKQPYKGKFYDFVKEILVSIYANDDINKNISFGQELKRTIKIYNSNPDAYRKKVISTLPE